MKTSLILLPALLLAASLVQAQVSFKSPIKNPGFEAQPVSVPTGAILDWSSNSLRGTGTYPLPGQTSAGVQLPATPHGQQAAVIAAGGILGTTVLNKDGTPMPIVPGSKISMSFHNIIPGSEASSNMGAYLVAGDRDGNRIAEAIPVRNCNETNGRITIDFVIYPASKLDATAPEWRKQAPFVKLQNFVGWVVLDDVQITVTAPVQ